MNLPLPGRRPISGEEMAGEAARVMRVRACAALPTPAERRSAVLTNVFGERKPAVNACETRALAEIDLVQKII
jgi:hypothetical protein